MATPDDEFAEFDIDEATFDAMMASAEPVEIVKPPAQPTVEFDGGAGHFRVTLSATSFLSVGVAVPHVVDAVANAAPRIHSALLRAGEREELAS